MIDEQLLHDFKRIAEIARALMTACDTLYTDLEAKSEGLKTPTVPTSHELFRNLDKGT